MVGNIERFKKISKDKGVIAALLKVMPYISFLAKKKKLEKKWGNVRLRSGDLEVRAWNTGPKIYWRDTELTKGAGLNTSVFIDGRWHDSSKARWDLAETSPSGLKLSNQWRYLPLKEIWSITTLGDNKISCKVELESKKDIEFIEQKFTAMLSERFEKWSTDKNKSSDFPKFKGWIDIKEAKKNSVFMKAGSKSGKELPDIVIKKIDVPQKNFYIQIQNSDYKTKARLLNIVASSRDGRLGYKKGASLFFNAEISVE